METSNKNEALKLSLRLMLNSIDSMQNQILAHLQDHYDNDRALELNVKYDRCPNFFNCKNLQLNDVIEEIHSIRTALREFEEVWQEFNNTKKILTTMIETIDILNSKTMMLETIVLEAAMIQERQEPTLTKSALSDKFKEKLKRIGD